jgi:hypothetical protein
MRTPSERAHDEAEHSRGWWRDDEFDSRLTPEQVELARLDWQARVWAAIQGIPVVDPAAPKPSTLRALPKDLMTISDASRAVGCQRTSLNQATCAGVVSTYAVMGAGRPRVSLAEVQHWQATRPRIVGRSGQRKRSTTMKRIAIVVLFLLLPASAALAQTFLVGQQPLTLAWDAPDGGGVEYYETTVGAGNRVNVGNVLTWQMPVMAVGTYTATVRACNHDAVTQAVQCSTDATLSFTLVNATPVPGTPGAPRIIPPTQVLDGQQIRQLADSFSYVHRLAPLRGQEWNWLSAQYTGPVPITYESEMTFLNLYLSAMLLLR